MGQADDFDSRLKKLRKAYRDAVDRFTKTKDIEEMRSAAAEMKALNSEVTALLKSRPKSR